MPGVFIASVTNGEGAKLFVWRPADTKIGEIEEEGGTACMISARALTRAILSSHGCTWAGRAAHERGFGRAHAMCTPDGCVSCVCRPR